MKPGNKNSYNSLKKISIDSKDFKYYSLPEAEKNGLDGISKLPKSLKVLLENLLRYEDDLSVTKSQIEAIKNWLKTKKSKTEIAYRPARVLLQDYTGIPAVADLAAIVAFRLLSNHFVSSSIRVCNVLRSVSSNLSFNFSSFNEFLIP